MIVHHHIWLNNKSKEKLEVLKMKWTVSCLQFDISYGNPSENFKKAESLIEQESRHADVIVLPELWTTGYDLTRLDQLADENGKVSEQWLKETAKHTTYTSLPDLLRSKKAKMSITPCTSPITADRS